jgi:CBS domain-containing protein
MIVGDIMHSATIVRQEMTVSEAAKLMKKKEVGSLLVKIHGKKYGMITERDILNKIVAEDLDPRKTLVKDIMTDLKYTIESDAPLEDASEVFNAGHVRRLPVIKDKEIVGIITSRDVAKRWIFSRYRKKIEYSRISGTYIR